MTQLLHSLEAHLDGRKDLLAVFDTVDRAKRFAQGEENETAEDDLAAADTSLDELALEWKTGRHETGDVAHFTEFDMSYSGAVYVILPVRLNPQPVA